jgi:branched-subunit amino acid aminotransferase/4-amino-4-deoxychorismate lyase|tara:strand:- start:2191 stop:2985 length:795 start_codon:yes stop_codon:yes gene_type:complete
MISYYKKEFLTDENMPINENLFRGLGVFETIKFTNQKMIFFDEHMDRLFSNNIFFNFEKITKNKIHDIAIQTINKNNLSDGLLKIIIIPKDEDLNDVEFYIFIRKLPEINTDSVKIKFYLESSYPILRFKPAFKSLFYMGNMLAIKDAKNEGIFEPIFYNDNNIITEGAIRNIFFIKNTTIYTPNLDLGILGGVTRSKVLDIGKKLNYKISESIIKYDDINNMDEAFITSTAIGILPCYWDSWNSNYSITLDLKNHYNQMIKIQ